MEELTIKYVINNPPTVKKEDRKGGYTVVYLEYQVSNNIELPSYTATRLGFDGIGIIAERYAKSIDWTWDYNKNQFEGTEPQKLKDLIYEYQTGVILKGFYDPSLPSNNIPGKSYKNQKYPKGDTLKSLYNQDPIAYTFSSIVVDKTTLKPLPEVKVKDLENQKTTTNPNGSFEITGTFSPGKPQRLIFNAKKYGVKDLLITTLNGSIRSDINVIELIPDVKDVSSSILKSQGTSDEERKRLTDEEKAEFIEATATEIIDTIKTRLIPYVILKLLCEPYGVCDPIGLITLAKLAKEKAKDANERKKEKKAEKELKK